MQSHRPIESRPTDTLRNSVPALRTFEAIRPVVIFDDPEGLGLSVLVRAVGNAVKDARESLKCLCTVSGSTWGTSATYSALQPVPSSTTSLDPVGIALAARRAVRRTQLDEIFGGHRMPLHVKGQFRSAGYASLLSANLR